LSGVVALTARRSAVGSVPGGFYACNRYERASKRGEHDAEEKQRDMAKHSLERYMHYYERWAAHEKSQVTKSRAHAPYPSP